MTANWSILESNIKSDIDERQRSMLQIKTLYLRYNFKENDEQMFLTYSIPAVYAIWEGFVQTSFSTYSKALNELNLEIDDVCSPILIHHLESKFPQFREYPNRPNGKKSFFDNLSQFYTNKSIVISSVVNTESNVGFDVINKILAAFNLSRIPEYSEPGYSVSQELTNLLKIRNSIAHGQGSVTVNRDNLEHSINLINLLMELVLERIINGFKTGSYKRGVN